MGHSTIRIAMRAAREGGPPPTPPPLWFVLAVFCGGLGIAATMVFLTSLF